MSQILLLTKNVLNEQSFENKLRLLGHEVFTSENLIDMFILENSNGKFLRMFTHVVLSETIANKEVRELIEKLKHIHLKILRKSDEEIDEDQLKEWGEQGIDDWIEESPSIEALREKMSQDRIVKEGKIIVLPKTFERRPLSNIHLSSGEMKLFMLLYQKDKRVVSRENLCLQMWGREKCNSTMSQLSVLVKHLKDKLSAQGIEGPIVETCWGQGYKLHDTVSDQLYVESSSLKYANK
ncbi:winged helix-turn-helix domain-containing protein [Enterococcus sp. DIV0187]|uniref:winged helix-turn-helix domain-containing protein n=1 Tax=Enterococcus sp. DIV0187 TaxID=2774644 RepID=UPI003F2838AC